MEAIGTKQIYRCKLCGTIEEQDIFEKSVQIAGIKMMNNGRLNTNLVHMCKKNQLGVFELIGLKEEYQPSILDG